MPERENVANAVIRDAKILHDKLVEALLKEVGHTIGFEEATKRSVRGLVRRAIQRGSPDSQAYMELFWLERVQKSQASREELYREIETVLAEGASAVREVANV